MPCAPASEWAIPETIEVLGESLHTNKLRTGHLHGNRFTIRLINLDIDAKARFLALWSRLERGILNSFGEQRFGHGGSNLQRAMDWLEGRFQLRGPKARFLKKLYPSVIQAEVFNRYLIRRLEASLDEPLPGEVVRLKGSGACFVIKNQADEKARWHLGDILPTGPMIGAKAYPAAESDALALEQRVANDLGLEGALLARLNVEAPGTRRDLLLFLDQPAFEWLEDQSLSISFALPAGAYATQVLRELTQEPWLKSARTRTNPEIGPKAGSDIGV
jgi:tRNA pseudouridine13 synthase